MSWYGAFTESAKPAAITFEQANANLDAAMAKLDKVLSNPNASKKAIASANTALNKATAALATATITRIENPVITNNTNVNNDEPPLVGSFVDPEPMTPATTPTSVAPVVAQPPPPPVKTAPIDTVLFDDEGTPIEVMTDLIFENIGGHELINIARNDIVNGQEVSYQPIKNLSSIQQQYNPNNIVSLQSTSDKYFANFSIKLENKIPQPGTGPNGAHVYLDQNTGNMIIEAINLESDEQIQVEITTSGTIYEAEFGEITS